MKKAGFVLGILLILSSLSFANAEWVTVGGGPCTDCGGSYDSDGSCSSGYNNGNYDCNYYCVGCHLGRFCDDDDEGSYRTCTKSVSGCSSTCCVPSLKEE